MEPEHRVLHYSTIVRTDRKGDIPDHVLWGILPGIAVLILREK